MSKSARSLSAYHRLKTAIGVFRASGQWTPQTIDNLDRWLDSRMAGAGSGTTHVISGETALNFAAYFSGVMQISQTMGSLRADLFKTTGPRKKQSYRGHPSQRVITKMANPYMNAYAFKETLQHHAITWGNGYAYKELDNYGNTRALWPMQPMYMRIEIEDSGHPVYVYKNPKTKKDKVYQWDEIFHLAGFGYSGLQGLSLIQIQAKAIDLGLTQQDFNINFINNGIHSSGVLMHPGELGTEGHANLHKEIEAQKAGLGNVGQFFILEEGMTWTPLSMPLKDAEFLAGRVFQIQEIARILNMPVHKLKDMSSATFSNIEHQQIEWVTDTLRPWAERWEICLDTQLLNPKQQNRLFFQFDLNTISRGDMKTQYESYRAARYAGWMSADDVLYKLGDNPLDDEEVGGRVWQPVNMIDAASDAAAGKAPVAPDPPPEAQPGNPEGDNDDGKE